MRLSYVSYYFHTSIFIYMWVGGCARIYVSCSLKNIKSEKKESPTPFLLKWQIIWWFWQARFWCLAEMAIFVNERKKESELVSTDLSGIALQVRCTCPRGCGDPSPSLQIFAEWSNTSRSSWVHLHLHLGVCALMNRLSFWLTSVLEFCRLFLSFMCIEFKVAYTYC